MPSCPCFPRSRAKKAATKYEGYSNLKVRHDPDGEDMIVENLQEAVEKVTEKEKLQWRLLALSISANLLTLRGTMPNRSPDEDIASLSSSHGEDDLQLAPQKSSKQKPNRQNLLSVRERLLETVLQDQVHTTKDSIFLSITRDFQPSKESHKSVDHHHALHSLPEEKDKNMPDEKHARSLHPSQDARGSSPSMVDHKMDHTNSSGSKSFEHRSPVSAEIEDHPRSNNSPSTSGGAGSRSGGEGISTRKGPTSHHAVSGTLAGKDPVVNITTQVVTPVSASSLPLLGNVSSGGERREASAQQPLSSQGGAAIPPSAMSPAPQPTNQGGGAGGASTTAGTSVGVKQTTAIHSSEKKSYERSLMGRSWRMFHSDPSSDEERREQQKFYRTSRDYHSRSDYYGSRRAYSGGNLGGTTSTGFRKMYNSVRPRVYDPARAMVKPSTSEEECTFRPKILEKSRRIASKRHKSMSQGNTPQLPYAKAPSCTFPHSRGAVSGKYVQSGGPGARASLREAQVVQTKDGKSWESTSSEGLSEFSDPVRREHEKVGKLYVATSAMDESQSPKDTVPKDHVSIGSPGGSKYTEKKLWLQNGLLKERRGEEVYGSVLGARILPLCVSDTRKSGSKSSTEKHVLKQPESHYGFQIEFHPKYNPDLLGTSNQPDDSGITTAKKFYAKSRHACEEWLRALEQSGGQIAYFVSEVQRPNPMKTERAFAIQEAWFDEDNRFLSPRDHETEKKHALAIVRQPGSSGAEYARNTGKRGQNPNDPGDRNTHNASNLRSNTPGHDQVTVVLEQRVHTGPDGQLRHDMNQYSPTGQIANATAGLIHHGLNAQKHQDDLTTPTKQGQIPHVPAGNLRKTVKPAHDHTKPYPSAGGTAITMDATLKSMQIPGGKATSPGPTGGTDSLGRYTVTAGRSTGGRGQTLGDGSSTLLNRGTLLHGGSFYAKDKPVGLPLNSSPDYFSDTTNAIHQAHLHQHASVHLQTHIERNKFIQPEANCQKKIPASHVHDGTAGLMPHFHGHVANVTQANLSGETQINNSMPEPDAESLGSNESAFPEHTPPPEPHLHGNAGGSANDANHAANANLLSKDTNKHMSSMLDSEHVNGSNIEISVIRPSDEGGEARSSSGSNLIGALSAFTTSNPLSSSSKEPDVGLGVVGLTAEAMHSQEMASSLATGSKKSIVYTEDPDGETFLSHKSETDYLSMSNKHSSSKKEKSANSSPQSVSRRERSESEKRERSGSRGDKNASGKLSNLPIGENGDTEDAKSSKRSPGVASTGAASTPKKRKDWKTRVHAMLARHQFADDGSQHESRSGSNTSRSPFNNCSERSQREMKQRGFHDRPSPKGKRSGSGNRNGHGGSRRGSQSCRKGDYSQAIGGRIRRGFSNTPFVSMHDQTRSRGGMRKADSKHSTFSGTTSRGGTSGGGVASRDAANVHSMYAQLLNDQMQPQERGRTPSMQNQNVASFYDKRKKKRSSSDPDCFKEIRANNPFKRTAYRLGASGQRSSRNESNVMSSAKDSTKDSTQDTGIYWTTGTALYPTKDTGNPARKKRDLPSSSKDPGDYNGSSPGDYRAGTSTDHIGDQFLKHSSSDGDGVGAAFPSLKARAKSTQKKKRIMDETRLYLELQRGNFREGVRLLENY